jgi:hypothetical protein
MHIGRGSGANSIISYCLWYYEHLSARTGLILWTFLNLNRKSPPDFDIDWVGKRDTILEYILIDGRDRGFLWHQWIQIPLDIPRRFWFTQRRTRCASKNPVQLHDNNSVAV